MPDKYTLQKPPETILQSSLLSEPTRL